MRRLLLVFMMTTIAMTCAACADLYSLGDYTTRDRESSPGEDSPSTTEQTRESAIAPRTKIPVAHCTTNAECAPNVCVKASGQCEPLVSPECSRVNGDPANENAVIVGTILDGALEKAALLAAAELANAGGRPLTIVSCDDTPGNVLGAAKHLSARLRVPAIVGPSKAEDVIEVTQQVSAKNGTLLLSPNTFATAIANLADSDLTWRTSPSDSQRANLVIAQMGALEDVLKTTRSLTSVKLGIVHRTDTLGTSARDAITGKLVLNGRFLADAANAQYVSIDAYGESDTQALTAIVTRYGGSFRPDLVFITAPEQIDGLLAPLERALTAARVVNRPYYVVTEAAKTPALLAAIAAPNMPADLKRRIRGVAATSDTKSAVARAGFESRLAKSTTFAEAATYDAMYAIGFAIAGTSSETTGVKIANGLRGLGIGAPMTVGPGDAGQVIGALASGKSVSLRGTSTLLQWDAKGDIAAGTVEAWCIGTTTGAPAFGSSGLAMDVATQVVAGTFVQCQ